MVSTATSNRRLLKLAAFLDTVPRKRFDYRFWVGDDWQGAPDLSCGTKGCALGWATTMPAFRRLGLRLHPGRFPQARKWSGFFAAVEIFGITELESEYLFRASTNGIGPTSPPNDATPKQVAAHIRGFVLARQSRAAQASPGLAQARRANGAG